MKEKIATTIPGHVPADTSAFYADLVEKIRLIAERQSCADQYALAKTSQQDLRAVVSKVLEDFQQEIIQRNIWIRIYDDHYGELPPLHPEACQAVAEVIKCALGRQQVGKMLAYVEISFLVNETGTVVTIEDNGSGVSVEELQTIPFLKVQHANVFKEGYTVQASIGNNDTGNILDQVSIRCVANCFTRFTACFPH